MNFDQVIDRTQYPTLKYARSQLVEHFGSDKVLPLWVADMDLLAPPAVVEALLERAQHGIYGYECKTDSYFDALVDWYATRHQWSIERTHIESCPSILSAIAILISQHTEQGDGIIIQPPVFFEFRLVIRSNGRRIIKNPLKLDNGRYQMDFSDLEAKAADDSAQPGGLLPDDCV